MTKQTPTSRSTAIYYDYDEDGTPEDDEDNYSQPSMIDLWNKLHSDNKLKTEGELCT